MREWSYIRARSATEGSLAMTTPPSDMRPARALFGDDVRAGRAPRDREPGEARWNMPGLRVAPFELYV